MVKRNKKKAIKKLKKELSKLEKELKGVTENVVETAGEEIKELTGKKEKKKPKKIKSLGYVVVIILVGIIIIGAILVMTQNSRMESYDKKESEGAEEEAKRECREVQVPYEDIEYYTETVPYTDTECESKELAYSVDNTAFDYDTCNQQEDLCIKYFLGICTEKKTYCIDRSASCSLDLRNLDSEEGGAWTIRHSFFEQGTNNVIKTNEVSIYLYAQTTKKVSGQIRIISQGETGDANRDIGSCNYQVLNVPTKQVCRDVIKYKEVTRTRTVTKYRTETACD